MQTTLVLYISEYLGSPGLHERDRQSDESSYQVPTLSSFLKGNPDSVEDAALPVLARSSGIDRGVIDESGPPIPPPPGDTDHLSEPLLILDSNRRDLQRLVSHDVPRDELPSVIKTIASSVKAADIVEYLQESDAQTFIDVMDEACHHAIPSIRSCFVDLFQPPGFWGSGVR